MPKRVGSKRLQGAKPASIGGINSSMEQIIEHIGGINTTHATSGSSGRGQKPARNNPRSGEQYDILKPTQICPDFLKSVHNYGHIGAVKNRF
jgi:hypothetical protein